jgi:hypothetical protein
LDQNFLKKELILRKTKSNENILRLIFLRSENFDEFNDFIENQFNISNSELKTLFIGNERARSWKRIDKFFVQPILDFLEVLIMKISYCFVEKNMKTTEQTFSSAIHFHIAQKSEEDQEIYLSFLKKKFGSSILNELISQESLFNICLHSDLFDDFGTKVLKFFDFVERKFGIDLLKELIFYKGELNRTFLFHLFQVADKDLIKILNHLFEKLKKQKDFLETLDYAGNSFLIFYFLFAAKTIKTSKEFFELIKVNFGLTYLKKLLLIRNGRNKNFHHVLLGNENGGVEKSLQVLEILLEVVGKDREFFIELTKQNEEILDEIKEFLQTNLGIGPGAVRFTNWEKRIQKFRQYWYLMKFLFFIVLIFAILDIAFGYQYMLSLIFSLICLLFKFYFYMFLVLISIGYLFSILEKVFRVQWFKPNQDRTENRTENPFLRTWA